MNEKINAIQQFAGQITTEYDVSKVIVYNKLNKIYGDTLDCVSLERYLSLNCTTIFKDNNTSRFVSHICLADSLYILVLISNSPDAFDGVEAQYIISQILTLKRKLGEIK